MPPSPARTWSLPIRPTKRPQLRTTVDGRPGGFHQTEANGATSFYPLAAIFQTCVAADVSRRHLRYEKNAPTDVGGYTWSVNCVVLLDQASTTYADPGLTIK